VILHFQYESDSMEKVLEQLHDGIDDVLDVLAIVGVGEAGALELTHALANLRAAYAYLECETSGQREKPAETSASPGGDS
jgi:hypothetical protein